MRVIEKNYVVSAICLDSNCIGRHNDTQVERFFGVLPDVASLNQVYESLFMQREWIGDGGRRIT
jgi:hypothetical protein